MEAQDSGFAPLKILGVRADVKLIISALLSAAGALFYLGYNVSAALEYVAQETRERVKLERRIEALGGIIDARTADTWEIRSDNRVQAQRITQLEDQVRQLQRAVSGRN